LDLGLFSSASGLFHSRPAIEFVPSSIDPVLSGAFSFRRRFGKSQKFSQAGRQAFALQWNAVLSA
jgi:hypothetical protein